MTRGWWWAVWIGVSLVASGAAVTWSSVHFAQAGFEGEMWLVPGTSSRYVLSAHDPSRPASFAAAPRHAALYLSDASPDGLPIAPAAVTLLPPDMTFDVVSLPFSLELRSATLLDASSSMYVLDIGPQSTHAEIRIESGQNVRVGDQDVTVVSIDRWGGLLRAPEGRPMADVAVRLSDGVWIEDVFLADAEWVRIGDRAALCLHWETAQDAGTVTQTPEVLRAARWGVVEGTAVHWMSSFLPGTAVVLRDGRQVTLAGMTADPDVGSVLSVDVQGPAGAEHLDVAANVTDESALVRLEDMALLDRAIVLRVGSSLGVELAVYVHGALDQTSELALGETWSDAGRHVTLRLEQLEPHALPLAEADSPLAEVTLEVGGERLRVRQGESARWGGTSIGFRRKTTPAVYALAIRAQAGSRAWEATIAPDRPASVGAWEFAAVPGEPRHGGYTVHARLVGERWSRWAGILLVAAGLGMSLTASWRGRCTSL